MTTQLVLNSSFLRCNQTHCVSVRFFSGTLLFCSSKTLLTSQTDNSPVVQQHNTSHGLSPRHLSTSPRLRRSFCATSEWSAKDDGICSSRFPPLICPAVFGENERERQRERGEQNTHIAHITNLKCDALHPTILELIIN